MRNPLCSLYILRHAQTDWNRTSRIQGSIDRPLSCQGKKQAQSMAEEFLTIPFSKIYSSPMRRARQTAEILGDLLNCPIESKSDLREGRYRALEGLTLKEFRTQYYDKIHCYNSLDQIDRFKHPLLKNTESYADLAARTIPCLLDIAQNHLGRPVLAVSHGWIMKALFIALTGSDDRNLIISNGAWIRIESNGEHLRVKYHSKIGYSKESV